MTSNVHGKEVLYCSKETKGTLIELINKEMPDPDKRIFMSQSGKRFVTYEQVIVWLIGRYNAGKRE